MQNLRLLLRVCLAKALIPPAASGTTHESHGFRTGRDRCGFDAGETWAASGLGMWSCACVIHFLACPSQRLMLLSHRYSFTPDSAPASVFSTSCYSVTHSCVGLSLTLLCVPCSLTKSFLLLVATCGHCFLSCMALCFVLRCNYVST